MPKLACYDCLKFYSNGRTNAPCRTMSDGELCPKLDESLERVEAGGVRMYPGYSPMRTQYPMHVERNVGGAV